MPAAHATATAQARELRDLADYERLQARLEAAKAEVREQILARLCERCGVCRTCRRCCGRGKRLPPVLELDDVLWAIGV